MRWIRAARRRAFMLTELLIVLIIIAILTGAVLLSGRGERVVEAFAEAGKLEGALRTLRSAWLAHYTATYELITPQSASTEVLSDAKVHLLEQYAGRSLAQERQLYGDITISVAQISAAVGGQPEDALFIGFTGGDWSRDLVREAKTRARMEQYLHDSRTRLYSDALLTRYTTGSNIFIRIR